jgi:hypothetical protein
LGVSRCGDKHSGNDRKVTSGAQPRDGAAKLANELHTSNSLEISFLIAKVICAIVFYLMLSFNIQKMFEHLKKNIVKLKFHY